MARKSSLSTLVRSRVRVLWVLLVAIVSMGIVAWASAPPALASTILHIPPDKAAGPSITIKNPSNGDRYTLDYQKGYTPPLDFGTRAFYYCTKVCLPIPGFGIGFVDPLTNTIDSLTQLKASFDSSVDPDSLPTPPADPTDQAAVEQYLAQFDSNTLPPALAAMSRMLLLPFEKLPTDTLGNHLVLVMGFDLDTGDPAAMGFGVEAAAYAVDPPVYRNLITAGNPLAYWRLNDKLGSQTMSDLTGNHNGTYKGHVALGRDGAPNCGVESRVTGGCNGDPTDQQNLIDDPNVAAAYFNGIEAYASVDNFGLPYQAYTIQAWVKPDGSSDMGIFQHGSGGMLGIRDGHFIFNPSSNFQSPVVTSSKSLSQYKDDKAANDGWYFLTATWDGKTAKLYVNGTDQNGEPDYLSKDGQPDGSVTGVTGLGPSTSTLYIGRVNTLPLFRGSISEVAYYDKAITNPDLISDQWETATYKQPHSVWAAALPPMPDDLFDWPADLDTTTPLIQSNISDGGTYTAAGIAAKNLKVDKQCVDPDPDDPASVLGILNLIPGFDGIFCVGPSSLDTSPGTHQFTITAYDRELAATIAAIGGGSIPNPDNKRQLTIHYTITDYPGVINADSPIAYYRLDDNMGSTVMADSSGNHYNGQYKNDQRQSGPGVSGGNSNTREFLGLGGYGYANNIAAPQSGYTLEAWVKPADSGDMMIAQHGGAGALFIRNGQLVFRQGEVEVTGPAPKPGVWTYVAGTFDGSHLRLYERAQSQGADGRDAMLVAGPKFAWLQQVDAPSGSGTFYVGYGDQVHTNTPWFRGQIDEVAYFGSALSTERLYQHWLADPPLVAPNPAVTGLIVPRVQSGPHVSMRMNVMKRNSRVQVEVYSQVPKRVLLGRVVRTHVGGRVKITVELNAKGRQTLRKYHGLTVKVIVRVTPPHGKAQQITNTVTLRS